jgi:hypothetical protein
VVHSGDDELRDTADRQACHKEHAAAADLSDDAAVNHDSEDAYGGEDAGVHEGTADIRHLFLALALVHPTIEV